MQRAGKLAHEGSIRGPGAVAWVRWSFHKMGRKKRPPAEIHVTTKRRADPWKSARRWV